jgi:hypothetical protein
MAANRGVYFRKESSLYCELPVYFSAFALAGGEPAFDHFIYLHGSACSNEDD